MMRVCCHKFSLLKDDYYAVVTDDCTDSMIISKVAYDLVSYFFNIIDYESGWFLSRDQDFYKLLRITHGDVYFGEELLVSGIGMIELEEWTIINGHVLLLLDITLFNSECGYLLVVMTAAEHRFVGSISTVLGGISSGELSKLIMVTPEIDWNV